MSSSRPLFPTGSSACQRAVPASCSCPASVSPTSRRSWWPQTFGGSYSIITEREEMSRGEREASECVSGIILSRAEESRNQKLGQNTISIFYQGHHLCAYRSTFVWVHIFSPHYLGLPTCCFVYACVLVYQGVRVHTPGYCMCVQTYSMCVCVSSSVKESRERAHPGCWAQRASTVSLAPHLVCRRRERAWKAFRSA